MRIALGAAVILFVASASGQPLIQPPQRADSAVNKEDVQRPDKDRSAPGVETKSAPSGLAIKPDAVKPVANKQTNTGNEKPDMDWWHELRTDPIATFTGLLFLATIALWWATRDLVKGAERSAKIDLRAYVSATVGPLPLATGEVHSSAIAVHCHNTGRTPAHEIWAHLTWHPAPPGTTLLPDDFDYVEKGESGGDISRGVLGANQGIAFGFDDDDGFIDHARRGQIELFVYGHVSYKLVFDDKRVVKTYFCYRYVNGGTTDAGRPIHGFRMYKDHNHAE